MSNKGMVSRPKLSTKKNRDKGANHWLRVINKAFYYKCKARGE